MALRAIVPRRDQLIAASLTGAVVIVVGYASGLGLKPGTAAENPPPVIAQPAPSGPSPVPDGKPPPPAPIPALPAVPVTDAPAPVAPPGPGGGVDAGPSAPPPEPVPPTHPHPEPPTTPPPPPEELPVCQPGAVQQVLDTVAALPLLGGVTGGLGVTGADGLGATLLGYCRAADGTVVLETVPVPVR
ncbi:Putative membrane protein [Amycolatopsis japonica]|uniref:Putative membrane protein n=1 Tax=Amycolatopsis japonica TaxID=208439 RepID=A0A075UU05_9PSEU|nr:hypothetical protein [Amycolatopsis japonica]AIG73640.1 Putative membrane protein [Amycolatopsis japonica]